MKHLSLWDLSKSEMLVNVILVPIISFIAIWYSYTWIAEASIATKEIKHWATVRLSEDYAMKLWLEEFPSNTDKRLEVLIDFRKSKLEKIQEWTSEEKTKELLEYKNFYDWLINNVTWNDFDTIATELTWLADAAWVEIISLTSWNAQPSRDLYLEWEDIIIYEKIFSLKLEDADKPWAWIVSYDKLKRFLKLLRDDIKTPYNTNIDISRWKKPWEEINFRKMSLKFFYKWEKK